MSIKNYLNKSSWNAYLMLQKKYYYIWLYEHSYFHERKSLEYICKKYVKYHFIVGMNRCIKMGFCNYSIILGTACRYNHIDIIDKIVVNYDFSLSYDNSTGDSLAYYISNCILRGGAIELFEYLKNKIAFNKYYIKTGLICAVKSGNIKAIEYVIQMLDYKYHEYYYHLLYYLAQKNYVHLLKHYLSICMKINPNYSAEYIKCILKATYSVNNVLLYNIYLQEYINKNYDLHELKNTVRPHDIARYGTIDIINSQLNLLKNFTDNLETSKKINGILSALCIYGRYELVKYYFESYKNMTEEDSQHKILAKHKKWKINKENLHYYEFINGITGTLKPININYIIENKV